MRSRYRAGMVRTTLVLVGLFACGGDDGSAGIDAPTAGNACALLDHTTPTTTISTTGCVLSDRDTSACAAERMAAGLSGAWLEFSCRVVLSATAGRIEAMADGQPEHLSNYFAATSPCHEAYTGGTQNPNH